jgi:ribA/ribD-fused uncharacterized protein
MAIIDFRDNIPAGNFKWLSNFYMVEVEYDGEIYPSTEHAYQAAKTMLPAERREIQTASTCGKSKRLGQKVKLRPDWEEIKVEVMRDLLRQKFAQPDLRQKLLATGDQHLVEGNTWEDYFWGVCNGRGLNHLGRLLMDVREECREA